MLGLPEFSLAALVKQYFDVTLAKGSQKANWARRPLPPAMEAYAKNDTHYLLPLAAKMEEQMRALGRMEWFRQSCQRALEQTFLSRERDPDGAWRITGSGTLSPQTGAVLRAIWQWRDREAQEADRPSFHILQNSAMIEAAKQFVIGETPEFRHLSERRRRGFLTAAREALELPETAWPQRPPRPTRVRTPGFDKKVEELRRRRDQHAKELAIDPSFIAPRSALEGIAADPNRSETLLVQWQRDLLGL
jgi:ribonuclease D